RRAKSIRPVHTNQEDSVILHAPLTIFLRDDLYGMASLDRRSSLLEGELLLRHACGTDGSLYPIDYALNSRRQATPVADGTAVRTRPEALTSCAGFAWDSSNETIPGSR